MANRFSKRHRELGNPVSYPAHNPRFIPVPIDPPANLKLSLDTILYEPEFRKIVNDPDKLVFHTVGDTGPVNGYEAIHPVVHAMGTQFQVADEDRPRFLYHLGDVVYFNGLERLYDPQFYEPYQYYPAPIFAIPGNHDGDNVTRRNDPPDKEKPLTGFLNNFCADEARYDNKYRETMTQPYVYWTLDTPLVTIIGLYSNVDGTLDGRGREDQQAWFEAQLAAAPKDKWLLLAVHHPCYSLDYTHGGYPGILNALDRAAKKANRWPDMVLSGHVHNYQRFERTVERRKIPFIVAGAGGYAHTLKAMHQLQNGVPTNRPYQTTLSDVKLMHCEEKLPGFLRVTVTERSLGAEYFTVPFGTSQDGVPTLVDKIQV